MAMMENPYAQGPAPGEGQTGNPMAELNSKLDYIIQLIESAVSEEASEPEDDEGHWGGEAQAAGDDNS